MKSLTEITRLFRESHLNHLNHPEENVFFLHGFGYTHMVLSNIHKTLRFKEQESSIDISVKIDGSPAIVFGYHPKTHKFFVGTKSVFNQKPKINYTDDDIIANHSHSPGLVQKLKDALKYLPLIVIDNHGVYQGDILFSDYDKDINDDLISFTPNTITYTVDSMSSNFNKIKGAKLGIAIHTYYTGSPYSNDCLEGMSAQFCLDDNVFNDSSLVYQSDINLDTTYSKYNEYVKVLRSLAIAYDMHSEFNTAELEAINYHALTLKTYFNSNIRNCKEYTDINDYYMYCKNKLHTDIIKLKTDKGREKRRAIKNNFLMHIINNSETLSNAIDVYHYIQVAKDILVHALNTSDHAYGHYVNNDLTCPEGYVAVLYGIPTKLVHRHEFSKLNFINSINV